MNRLRLVIWLLPLFAASGCQLGLVDRTDGMREQQINAYHSSVVEFVATAENTYGTESARYGSETSLKFYAKQRARLSNLVVNAEAADDGRECPVAFVRSILAIGQIPDGGLQSDTSIVTDNKGSCTVIVLRHLELAHETLEAVHAHDKYLSAPASELALAGVEDAVRIALKNEATKK